MKTPTKKDRSQSTDDAPADAETDWEYPEPNAPPPKAAEYPELYKRVVDEIERLTALERKSEREVEWERVSAHRAWLREMAELSDDMGRHDDAETFREMLGKLKAQTGKREPSLKKLREIRNAARIDIEKQAEDAARVFLTTSDPETAARAKAIADPLLTQLRGSRTTIEDERAKVLRAMREGRSDTSRGHGKGDTSRGPKNMAKRIARGDY